MTGGTPEVQKFNLREVIKKRNVPFSSLLLLSGGGVGGDVKNY